MNVRTNSCFPEQSRRLVLEAAAASGMDLEREISWVGRGRQEWFPVNSAMPTPPTLHPQRQQKQRWISQRGSSQSKRTPLPCTEIFLCLALCGVSYPDDLAVGHYYCSHFADKKLRPGEAKA